MANKKNSRDDMLTADQRLIDGLQKNQAKLPGSFPLEGQSQTPAGVEAVLQERIVTGKAVLAAEAARTSAVKADRDKRAQTAQLVLQLRHLLVAMFAKQPDVLADFGLSAPKKGTKTVKVKAQAAEKASKTREVLGTKGVRQKKAALEAASAQPASPPEPKAPEPAPPAPAPVPAASAAPAKPVS